jgi:hypothetical protein
MTTKRNQCESTKRNGEPCQAQALPNSPHCWAHDPELQERRQEARKRGGKNRSGVVRLRGLVPPRLLPVFDTLEQAL